jgi:hypothetical protein
MSKLNSAFAVTTTGYTERIPNNIECDRALDNIVYIYCDPYWRKPGFMIPKKKKKKEKQNDYEDLEFEKISYDKWKTSKRVKTEWRDIHDAMTKVYGKVKPFTPYNSTQTYTNHMNGYIVTRDGGIKFSPMDYCYGSFWKSETIKTDGGLIVPVSIWDCESG